MTVEARAFEPGSAEAGAVQAAPAALVVRRPRRRVATRALDLLVAGVLVVGLAPVMVAVAALVRATSPGPVIFRQVRVGRQGRPITIYKFRTMVRDAEERLVALRPLNEADGPLFKLRADPRLTPVGRWLRHRSLDELPQLFNVLGGSMSLVGPRPALPHEAAAYAEDARRRLLVKPGLTGLWQVSGRSDLDWHEGVRLDLHYVEHGTLWLDLRILLRTVPAVLLGRGAY